MGAAPKPKAAPIALPSADYKWKIQNREYGGDEKERREETRRQEAEERRQAREAGQQVDIGAGARYWEQVATAGASKGSGGKSLSSRKGAGKNVGKEWRDFRGHQEKQPTTDPWSQWKNSQGEAGGKSWSSKAVTVTYTGHSWSSKGGDWEARKPDWKSQDWQSEAWGSNGWHNSGDATGGTSQSSAGNGWHNLGDASGDTSGNSAGRAAKPREVFLGEGQRHRSSPDTKPEISQPACGMDDEGLARLLDDTFWQSHSYGSSWSIDLAENRLTDAGVGKLADHLRRSRIRCNQILLQGNPLREPKPLWELLKDETVGLKADLRVLAISSQLSCECLWRTLEACFFAKPRPPLRLCLDAELPADLRKVLEAAKKNGVRIAESKLDGQPGAKAAGLMVEEDVDVVLVTPEQNRRFQ